MCNVCFLVVVKAFLAMLQTWWNTSLSFLKHYICFFLTSCRHMLHTLPDRWHITFAFSWHVAYASWHNIYFFPDMLHTLPDITFTFSWHVTYASWHGTHFYLCIIRFPTIHVLPCGATHPPLLLSGAQHERWLLAHDQLSLLDISRCHTTHSSSCQQLFTVHVWCLLSLVVKIRSFWSSVLSGPILWCFVPVFCCCDGCVEIQTLFGFLKSQSKLF